MLWISTVSAIYTQDYWHKILAHASLYEIYSLNKEVHRHCCQKWEGAVHMTMMTQWCITPQENSGTRVKSSRSIQVMLMTTYMSLKWVKSSRSIKVMLMTNYMYLKCENSVHHWQNKVGQVILEGIAVNKLLIKAMMNIKLQYSYFLDFFVCFFLARHTPSSLPKTGTGWFVTYCISQDFSTTVTSGSVDNCPMLSYKKATGLVSSLCWGGWCA